MAYQVTCDCGIATSVTAGAAGTTIECVCGKTLDVPSLASLQAQTPEAAAATRPARKRSWRKKLLFSGVALLLISPPLYLLLELSYRAIFSIPITGGLVYQGELKLPDTPVNREFVSRFRLSDNPVLFYEPTPGVVSGLYEINSQGFRDREYTLEKPADVFRIVMLGDSIIWGHGVPLADSLPKQLEQQLNDRFDQRFEVLNFGVSGYSTQQEVELFRAKASRYHPDLVIVGYCLNDYTESSAEGAAFRRIYYDLFSKSYLYDHLRRAVLGLSFNVLGYTTYNEQAQFDLRKQFQLLQEYSGDRRGMVVVFPVLADFQNYLFGNEHLRVEHALRGLNFETLDLYNAYRDHDPESLILVPRDRTHPNKLGHQIAADAIIARLVEEEMLPVVAE